MTAIEQAEPVVAARREPRVRSSDRAPRIGLLLCINGAGSMHRWLRRQVAALEQQLSGSAKDEVRSAKYLHV